MSKAEKTSCISRRFLSARRTGAVNFKLMAADFIPFQIIVRLIHRTGLNFLRFPAG